MCQCVSVSPMASSRLATLFTIMTLQTYDLTAYTESGGKRKGERDLPYCFVVLLSLASHIQCACVR